MTCGRARQSVATACITIQSSINGSFTMRILIVDDSEDGRDIAEAMLLSAGYADVSTVISNVTGS